jgi:hypothetical protein
MDDVLVEVLRRKQVLDEKKGMAVTEGESPSRGLARD